MVNLPVNKLSREMILDIKRRSEKSYNDVYKEGMTDDEKEFLRIFCIAIEAARPVPQSYLKGEI